MKDLAALPPWVAPSAAAAAQNADSAFDTLAEAYYEEVLVLYPVLASSIGDARFNDRYRVQFAQEQRAASLAVARKYTDALGRIDAGRLDASRGLSYRILQRNLANTIEGDGSRRISCPSISFATSRRSLPRWEPVPASTPSRPSKTTTTF